MQAMRYATREMYERSMGRGAPQAPGGGTAGAGGTPGRLPWEPAPPPQPQTPAPGGGQQPFGLGSGLGSLLGGGGGGLNDIMSRLFPNQPPGGGLGGLLGQFFPNLGGGQGGGGQTPQPSPQPQQPAYQEPQLMQRPRLPNRFGGGF